MTGLQSILPNDRQNVRVVGGSYTTFQYAGKNIAYLEGFEDSGQAPFSDAGGPYQPIHPLGQTHPVEIATSRVVQVGQLNLTIRELWNYAIWEHLAGLTGSNNIIDIYEALAANPAAVTCTSIIRPPNGGKVRGKIFHGCVVTAIADNDTVTIGALTVAKGIQVAYTHSSRL